MARTVNRGSAVGLGHQSRLSKRDRFSETSPSGRLWRAVDPVDALLADHHPTIIHSQAAERPPEAAVAAFLGVALAVITGRDPWIESGASGRCSQPSQRRHSWPVTASSPMRGDCNCTRWRHRKARMMPIIHDTSSKPTTIWGMSA
jgi:hypothetical protein